MPANVGRLSYVGTSTGIRCPTRLFYILQFT